MNERDMPLSRHLEELRRRALTCAVPLLLLIPVGYSVSPGILTRIFDLCTERQCEIYLMGVADGLLLRIRAGVLLACLALFPLLLTESALFLFPGLYPRERRALILLCVFGGLSFSGGVTAFILRLAPWAVNQWLFRGSAVPAMLSAVTFFDMWLVCALLCGILACLPAVFLIVLRLKK